MKYFSPSYWLKMWVLSAPLFNDQTQGVYAKSINNKNIKDWASENTKGISVLEQQESNFTNSTEFLNYQTHLDTQNWAKNLSQDTSTDSSWNLEARPKNDQQATLWEHEFEEQHHQDLQAEHNRHKRHPNQNNWKYNLNIPLFRQENHVFCAVACVEAILRHLKLDIPSLLNEINAEGSQYTSFQLYLADRISDSAGNFFSQNIHRTLNQIINWRLPNTIQYSLDYFWQMRYFNPNENIPIPSPDINYDLWIQAFYNEISSQLPSLTNQIITMEPYLRYLDISNTELCRLINEVAILRIDAYFANEFYRNLQLIVTSSLSSNLPLIFEQSFGAAASITENTLTGHAILIVDVSSDNITPETDLSQIRYRVIDPWTGQYATLTALDLYRSSGEISSLISHNPHDIRLQSIQFLSLNENDVSLIHIDSLMLLKIIEDTQNDINFRLLFGENLNCGNREKRYLKNSNKNILNRNYCDLKPQINNIKGKISIVKILDEHTKGGHLKAGDIYVGTDKGVYLIHGESRVDKFYGLNFPITSIELDGHGSAYVTNKQGEIYHLNLDGWGSKKIQNMESSDLNKEIKLYYNDAKSEKKLTNYPVMSHYNNKKEYVMNLYHLNPVEYFNKLDFLGDYYSDGWGVRVEWGSWIYDVNHKHGTSQSNGQGQPVNSDLGTIMRERQNKFHDIIENKKNGISYKQEQVVQDLFSEGNTGCEKLKVKQKFGLNWYWENENYYLQVIFEQYCEWWCSGSSLNCNMKIGSGIRLYNDNTNTKSKRDVFDINKLDDKKYTNQTINDDELQNTTQWEQNITNLINQEQHLPIINNQSSYVNNNVTTGV